MIQRAPTRKVMIGGTAIGGQAPITVQSMTSTDTRDIGATVRQIKSLARAGCEIVRVAVPDQQAANGLGKIKAAITIPLVADIHFDHRLALIALEQGVDKIRINPGNIGSAIKVKSVVERAREKQVPIRVGVNAGSLEPSLRKKYGTDMARALVESALREVRFLEKCHFKDIVVSLKASDIFTTRAAYRLAAQKMPYPLHVGITEAGLPRQGTVTSAIGIGSLLLDGIGDTIRVSLTGDPVEEVRAGQAILRALDLRQDRPRLISCPTCGRCQVNLFHLARRIDRQLAGIKKPITVAVMGCMVNGPGEAREADIGVAGGKGCGLIFKKGKIIKKVKEKEIVGFLLDQIGKL
jgi:(E)-4-hydroxy-3-methylbut-2-enyl-diphosphate synthase